MVDKLSPNVTITLDRERHLRLGLRAMRAFEQETGKSIRSINAATMTDTQRVVLLWAALLHDDKELTLDQAITLFDDHLEDLGQLADKVVEMQKASAPEADTAPLVETPTLVGTG
jgi:hypothetical protein